MRQLRAWLMRLLGVLGRGRRREREMAAEFESHIQLHVDDGVRRGLSIDDARREALARFGPVESIKEAHRDRGSLPFAEVFLQDLRNGVRVLRRYAGLTSAAVITLALGVGANTAMLSLVDALMFRPPAGVRDPERLVEVHGARNYVRFRELQRSTNALDIAAQSIGVQRLSLGLGADAEPIAVACVTAGYFDVMGARTAAGRAFRPGEDAAGHPRLVVLSHGYWKRRFGASPAVLDRFLPIGGLSHRVIGVAEPGFKGLDTARVDAWILLPLAPEVCSFTGTNLLASTSGSWLNSIGRIRGGYSFAEAETETARLPADATGRTIRLEPVHPAASSTVPLTRDARLALWLAAGAGLVLLIACANVGGLLSVRAIERRREIAVRLQLGASRRRVFTQLLIENLLLAVLCAIAAAGVAVAASAAVPGFFPQVEGGSLLTARSWWLLAAFAMAASAVSGLVPAIQAVRMQTAAHFRDHHSADGGRSRGRTSLVIAQIAVALMLVVAAGLFARSVTALGANPGFDLDRVVIATADLEKAGIRRQAEIRAIFDVMLQRVRALPGVEAAALTSRPPLGSARSALVTPSSPGQASRFISFVSGGYFETMGTRIVKGRALRASDAAAAPPVMVVGEAVAAEMWPGQDPIGKCGARTFGGACIEVVGVSERRRYGRLIEADHEVFYPIAQRATSEGTPQALVVRTRASADGEVAAVSQAVQGASPELPFVMVRPLEDLADGQTRSWRLGAAAFGLFGTLALVLAAIGIFATLSFSVRQRTREIGVRMALGADRGAVLRMILRQGLGFVVTGWLAGAAGAFVLARYIQSLLHKIDPGDPATFAAASGVLMLAALAGCIVPALRASRVDASVALRCE